MEKGDDMHVEHWVDKHLAELNPDSEWRPDARGALSRLRERRASERPGRKVWVAATVLIACAGAMALPGTRVLAERCIGACSEAWQSFRSGGVAPTTQDSAPDFVLSDANGNPVRLSDFRGKVVLLNFWATWCPPCRVEIPWFIEFQQAYGDRGFLVLGVSMDEDGWNSVKPYMTANGIRYRMVIGDDKLAELYGGVESLPTTFIIDKSGRIAATHAGLVSKSAYREGIEALLDK